MEVNDQEEQLKEEQNEISQQQSQQNELTETQLNQSQINRVQNENSALQEQVEQQDNIDKDGNQEVQSVKQNSVLATPTKTNEHETSQIDSKELIQPLEESKKSGEEINEQKIENDDNKSDQSQNDDKMELQISYYNELELAQNNEIIQQNEQQQQIQEESQQQSRQSQRSSLSEKINNLEIVLRQKDELITTLQDEIQLLKQYKNDKQDEIGKIEKKFEEQLDKLNKKIIDLEKNLKEKENDIEQYRNGNQTLHLQDLSVISVQKNDNLKSNANEKKDITIFEVLNEKQTTADLSELGNNFWLISAERKISKNNPLYKDYFPKEPELPQNKNKVIINHPTKKYDKSYWFKYVELKKNPRYNHNVVLPKLSEPIVSLQNEQNNSMTKQQNQQELQQQIIQSIQQSQMPYGFSQTTTNKVNQVTQSIPFSQKLLANNQRGGSQQQKQKYVQTQQQSNKKQNAQQEFFDPDDFLADQEIEQMFAQNNPPKKQQINWDQQPAKNLLIVQHTNSSQVIEQKEKFPILSQKLSYVNQYSHKRDVSRINESQNNNRTKIIKYQ